MTAFIISIDGPDFSGKSTTAALLIEELKKGVDGVRVKHTQLPSTLVTGAFPKILRAVSEEVSGEVFSLAYGLDHLYHNQTVIDPLVKSSKKYLVVQERSLLSTMLYQGLVLGTDLEWMKEVNKYMKYLPDMTIITKVDINELLRRKDVEKRDFDQFESAKFLEKQIKVFDNIPKDLVEKFNVVYIDANREVGEVVKEIAGLVRERGKEFLEG